MIIEIIINFQYAMLNLQGTESHLDYQIGQAVVLTATIQSMKVLLYIFATFYAETTKQK